MRRTIFLLIVILTLGSLSELRAQQYVSDASPVNHYQRGTELLDKKKFGAARKEFQAYLAQEPNGAYAAEAEYYTAYAAVRLYNPDGPARLAVGIIQPDVSESSESVAGKLRDG